jgi:hypothetical protein
MGDEVKVNSTESSSYRAKIADEAARIEEDATYASKSHFNDADSWDRRHLWLGGAGTILAAGAGATGLLSGHPTLAALISFASAGATAVLTFQKPGEHASAHRVAGAGYTETRQRARQLRNVGPVGPESDDALRKTLDEIATQKAQLDKQSPVPSRPAFERARAGIEGGEATHVIDSKGP